MPTEYKLKLIPSCLWSNVTINVVKPTAFGVSLSHRKFDMYHVDFLCSWKARYSITSPQLESWPQPKKISGEINWTSKSVSGQQPLNSHHPDSAVCIDIHSWRVSLNHRQRAFLHEIKSSCSFTFILFNLKSSQTKEIAQRRWRRRFFNAKLGIRFTFLKKKWCACLKYSLTLVIRARLKTCWLAVGGRENAGRMSELRNSTQAPIHFRRSRNQISGKATKWFVRSKKRTIKSRFYCCWLTFWDSWICSRFGWRTRQESAKRECSLDNCSIWASVMKIFFWC